ncbi:MAG: hypothetical protein H8E61_11390 [Bacteroidetes bacterium]|nr:hypothetical protein [Bacteroidota bacterium]
MKIVQQADGVSRSLRGLSVVNDQIAWLSGTNGTVGITIDGGKNWHENIVEGAENLDFRDIEAINDKVAWIVSAGVPGRIYKTIDGGNKWNLQYEKTENVFFDSFVFSDINNGMAVGDPEAGEFFLLRTSNSGKTWEEIDGEKLPDAINGEALFAASGTCITTYGNDNIWFITGGTSAARAFCSYDSGESWIAAKTPISYGSSSKGIFSVAFYNKLTGIIVGGDYAIDSLSNENTALTYDGGKTWDLVEKQRPDGFKSCVSYVPETGGKGLIATGTSGVDYSIDGGLTWKNISKDSYNVVAFGNTFDSGWLCGSGGKIAKIIFEIKK